MVTGDDEYYFLPNLTRGTKMRHVLKKVRVEGQKSGRYPSIRVNELHVADGGGFEKVWSREWQQNVWAEDQFSLEGSR